MHMFNGVALNTTNHRKPPQTTTNHYTNQHKPLQITHNSYKKVVNQIFKPKLSMIKVFWGNKAETKMKLYFLLPDPTPSNIPYVI